MMRLPMSDAASALLRAIVARAGVRRDRILLSEIRSTDWQSLTFVGERHELHLRITGSDAAAMARRLTDGIGEADFALGEHVVADIALAAPLRLETDGAVDIPGSADAERRGLAQRSPKFGQRVVQRLRRVDLRSRCGHRENVEQAHHARIIFRSAEHIIEHEFADISGRRLRFETIRLGQQHFWRRDLSEQQGVFLDRFGQRLGREIREREFARPAVHRSQYPPSHKQGRKRPRGRRRRREAKA